jgi:hypothetical protein
MPTEIKGGAGVTEETALDSWNDATSNTPNTVFSSQSSPPNMAKAPDGVPSIVGWKTLENGK